MRVVTRLSLSSNQLLVHGQKCKGQEFCVGNAHDNVQISGHGFEWLMSPFLALSKWFCLGGMVTSSWIRDARSVTLAIGIEAKDVVSVTMGDGPLVKVARSSCSPR